MRPCGSILALPSGVDGRASARLISLARAARIHAQAQGVDWRDLAGDGADRRAALLHQFGKAGLVAGGRTLDEIVPRVGRTPRIVMRFVGERAARCDELRLALRVLLFLLLPLGARF